MSHAFPEADYRPHAAYAPTYALRVGLGRVRAANSTVAICACARDVAHNVDRLRDGVAAIGDRFADHAVFLYENDSVDDTRDALLRWAAADHHVHFAHATLNRPRWPAIRSGERGDHMADYRNACAKLVRESGMHPDVVVVLDADLAGWSDEGIMATLGCDGWDAMGSQGLKQHKGATIQYDVWAWRDIGHPGSHPAYEINSRVYDRGHPPVPVLSCFGGMAVYRGAVFAAGHYCGGDCEHVLFHRSLADAGHGRIFLNPAMLTLYPA